VPEIVAAPTIFFADTKRMCCTSAQRTVAARRRRGNGTSGIQHQRHPAPAGICADSVPAPPTLLTIDLYLSIQAAFKLPWHSCISLQRNPSADGLVDVTTVHAIASSDRLKACPPSPMLEYDRQIVPFSQDHRAPHSLIH
jgi:hypothetical protein